VLTAAGIAGKIRGLVIGHVVVALPYVVRTLSVSGVGGKGDVVFFHLCSYNYFVHES
jgi:hypothetical protein